MSARTCRDCDKRIAHTNKSALCQIHLAADPVAMEVQRARQRAGIAAKFADPAYRAMMSERMTTYNRKPETLAIRSADARRRRIWEIGHLHCNTEEVNARRSRSISNTKLAHIPRAYRDQYRTLVQVKRVGRKEAERMIREQMAADEAHYRKTGEIRVGAR